MGLLRHEITVHGCQGSAKTHTEHGIDQGKKIRQTFKKRKEGTEGIDALDEIPETERLNEGLSMLSSEDY